MCKCGRGITNKSRESVENPVLLPLQARVGTDEELKLSDTLRYYMKDTQAAKVVPSIQFIRMRSAFCWAFFENLFCVYVADISKYFHNRCPKSLETILHISESCSVKKETVIQLLFFSFL